MGAVVIRNVEITFLDGTQKVEENLLTDRESLDEIVSAKELQSEVRQRKAWKESVKERQKRTRVKTKEKGKDHLKDGAVQRHQRSSH